MPRPPRPEDLYQLRVATKPRLSPDGRLAVVTLQTVAPGFDGYRRPLARRDGRRDGAAPADHRRETRPIRALLAGRANLAFLSDRRTLIEEEPDRSAPGFTSSHSMAARPAD